MLIGMPLCFDLEKVKSLTKDIKLRMVVNYAYDEYIPRLNGIKGQYVRPEDIPIYAQYISTFEFRTNGEDWITKEAALFHVYKDNQMWPGNLNLLITNLNKNVDNRAFPTSFGEVRSNCGQRCERNGTCHFCESTFLFVEQLKKEHNRRKKREN